MPRPGLDCESLAELCHPADNPSVVRYRNRKPEYDPERKSHFVGVPEPAEGVAMNVYDPKNFVLEGAEGVGLVCARMSGSEDKYYMEVQGGLSPLQGFAVCLSNLERKLLVE